MLLGFSIIYALGFMILSEVFYEPIERGTVSKPKLYLGIGLWPIVVPLMIIWILLGIVNDE